jgi:hypothetical protein
MIGRHEDCDHCVNRERCDEGIEVDAPDCFFEDTESEPEPREDHFRDDVEADADVLKSAGWGTDEDYGGFDDMDRDFCGDDY